MDTDAASDKAGFMIDPIAVNRRRDRCPAHRSAQRKGTVIRVEYPQRPTIKSCSKRIASRLTDVYRADASRITSIVEDMTVEKVTDAGLALGM